MSGNPGWYNHQREGGKHPNFFRGKRREELFLRSNERKKKSFLPKYGENDFKGRKKRE